MPGWKYLFRRAKEQDFDREVSFHIEELTQANIAKGMSAAEAKRRALIEFGGAEQVKQQIREAHGSRWMTSRALNL